MQALSGIAFAALVACAWLVGTRLLLLARRTRALPETCLGAAMLCLMGIGYPLAVGAQAEKELGLLCAKGCQILANGLIDAGFALIYLFTFHVFRRHDAWARVLPATGIAVLAFHWVVVTFVVAGLDTIAGAIEATRGWAQLALGAGCAAYVWAAIEALRYHALLRRRLALGLADPVVANRLLLWAAMGIATAAAALTNVYFMLARIDVLSDPIAQSVVAVTGIAQAALLYLTFLPPAVYIRWVAGSLQPTR